MGTDEIKDIKQSNETLRTKNNELEAIIKQKNIDFEDQCKKLQKLKDTLQVKTVLLNDQNDTISQLKLNIKNIENEFKLNIEKWENEKIDYKDEIHTLNKNNDRLKL